MMLALTLPVTKLITMAAVSLSALFGPPRIQVTEVTPGHTAPAGAVLLVEGHHHQESATLTITGRAEGMKNGQRITLPLKLDPAGGGRFAVMRQWTVGTPWVLVLAAGQGEDGAHGVAEALVKIDASGKLVGIEYPAAGWIGTSNTPKRTSTDAINSVLLTLASKR
ncbi:MAG: hypothetical protein H7099_01105 [Gemmatimonadaceae bacterium]|nr:hypothetical protein [Gemmatimonadaceae bacterium]